MYRISNNKQRKHINVSSSHKASGVLVVQRLRCWPQMPMVPGSSPAQRWHFSPLIIPLILGQVRSNTQSSRIRTKNLGGPVCTLRTLKNPWQLKIEKSRPVGPLSGQNSKLIPTQTEITLDRINDKEYLRKRNVAAYQARDDLQFMQIKGSCT